MPPNIIQKGPFFLVFVKDSFLMLFMDKSAITKREPRNEHFSEQNMYSLWFPVI